MWVISSADLQLFFFDWCNNNNNNNNGIIHSLPVNALLGFSWIWEWSFLHHHHQNIIKTSSSSPSSSDDDDDEIHSRRIYISLNLEEGPTSGFLAMWHSVCHGNLAKSPFSPFLALLLVLLTSFFLLQRSVVFLGCNNHVRVSCQNRRSLFGLTYQRQGN